LGVASELLALADLAIVSAAIKGVEVLKYVVRRLILLIAIVFVISVGSFYLIHLLPGDPATIILGAGDTPHNRAVLYKQLGLNRGIVVQYFVWLNHVLHGNLGTSFITNESVLSTIGAAYPIDIEMIILSQILAFAFAIPLAMRAAQRPGGRMDKTTSAGSFTLLSIPPFIIIVFLVLIVAIKLKIPNTGPASFVPWGQDWIVNLESMVLPAITLAIGSFVLYFRILRTDLISTLQEEFITLARSKGISRRRIMWRHAFRPSSISLLGTAGVNIGGLIAGGFVVQYLLAIPGLGYTLVDGINTADYLLVQGIVLVIAVSVVLINFLFDFLITVIDPRIARD